MDLLPAIDIRGGKCVQLQQGDYARETVYGVDPVAMAQHWHAQGASRLHIVDLDAAKEGRPVNDAVIRRIVNLLRGEVSIQVAGGVRDHNAIHRWIESGADRVVVGTLAVQQPDVVEKAMEKHQQKIAVAVDAKGGKAAVKGWLETSDTPVDPFIADMARRGVRHFIYTDTSRDGMLQHLDFGLVRHLLQVLAETGAPASLIYSGGVTSIEDVIALAQHPLEGAIIGTALYDGRIDLEVALTALATGDGT
ncbi:MAG: 1-(5-phosphoribosyl)-5-[(5-phosphoribosylamino)methylideneamino]imidazole-4-carboxamide isomerase [Chloroflexi bacterium]|nr:1-(5-phosphoribosyl)-5-[(5-phosphoribosylamino)methylideneamino]imidazole-4-carboxamide isomerase [Chloroflexota bacterium]